MKRVKRFGTFIITICLASFILAIPASAEEFNYNDYSDQHTYPTEALKQLIEVYSFDESYDAREVQAMIDRLDAIPANIIEESVLYGARLAFIDFTIPQFEPYAHLAGVHPRGHAEHITWEDMFGIASGPLAVSTIGYTYPRDYQGSVQLDIHEFFHVVDYIMLGTPINELEEFISIHEAEQNQLDPGNDYYTYIDEYFAEAAAFYYRGGDYRQQLKNRAPETDRFFANLHKRLLTIDEFTASNIVLTWPENDETDTYIIYRDDEPISQTTSASFTDQSFESFTAYTYHIVGLDENDKTVFESLPRVIWTDESITLNMVDDKQISLIEATENKITFEWQATQNASHYEIYRDDTYIGQTYDTFYEDFVYASDREFTYVIRAMNKEGDYVEYEAFTAKTKEKDNEPSTLVDSPQYFSDLENISSTSISPMIMLIIGIGIILFILFIALTGTGILLYILMKKNKKTG